MAKRSEFIQLVAEEMARSEGFKPSEMVIPMPDGGPLVINGLWAAKVHEPVPIWMLYTDKATASADALDALDTITFDPE